MKQGGATNDPGRDVLHNSEAYELIHVGHRVGLTVLNNVLQVTKRIQELRTLYGASMKSKAEESSSTSYSSIPRRRCLRASWCTHINNQYFITIEAPSWRKGGVLRRCSVGGIVAACQDWYREKLPAPATCLIQLWGRRGKDGKRERTKTKNEWKANWRPDGNAVSSHNDNSAVSFFFFTVALIQYVELELKLKWETRLERSYKSCNSSSVSW